MRAAIVGCGIMGAAAAWSLSRRGHDVTIYEQFEVGHTRGSSHGATRIYRYSYPDPRYVVMMKEAMSLWAQLEQEAASEILQQTGGLDTGKNLEAHADALAANGIPFEMLGARAAAERWPQFSLPDDEVLYQGDGGIVRAENAWKAFVNEARDRGARLVEERRIDDIGPDGLADYDVTIVTAGGWAKALLSSSGVDLEVRPTRETVVFFRTEQAFPTLVDWGDPSVYALHDPGYGLKVGEHIAGPPTDPDEEGTVSAASVARLREWVAARFPTVDPTPAWSETCIYTNTPDEHFVLERRGSIVIGSACSGHGFKFAPLIGERVADLAEG